MGKMRDARIRALEQKAEIQKAKASKTLRRSGPHIRSAQRAEQEAAKLRTKNEAEAVEQIEEAAQVEQSADSLPPAAWYADPHGQADLRYWDGSVWTPHTATIDAD